MKKLVIWEFISGGDSHITSRTGLQELSKPVAVTESLPPLLVEIQTLPEDIKTVTIPPPSAEALHFGDVKEKMEGRDER